MAAALRRPCRARSRRTRVGGEAGAPTGERANRSTLPATIRGSGPEVREARKQARGPRPMKPVSAIHMARPERFELPTAWFVARYSIQLSYGRARRVRSIRPRRCRCQDEAGARRTFSPGAPLANASGYVRVPLALSFPGASSVPASTRRGRTRGRARENSAVAVTATPQRTRLGRQPGLGPGGTRRFGSADVRRDGAGLAHGRTGSAHALRGMRS